LSDFKFFQANFPAGKSTGYKYSILQRPLKARLENYKLLGGGENSKQGNCFLFGNRKAWNEDWRNAILTCLLQWSWLEVSEAGLMDGGEMGKS
jgi:hypothetical protein